MSDSKELLAKQVEDGAKTYWMLGWSWDEIESIFDDMGVPGEIIESGMKKAESYANKIIKKGPFNIYHKNQLIKLHNGETGQVDSISPKYITICLEDGDLMQVRQDDIDVGASKALTQAYVLRQMANKLKVAQKEDYLVPTRPKRYQVQKTTVEPPLSVTVKPSPGAPPGWSKVTPHMNEIEEASETVGQMLNEIDVAQDELQEVKSELKIANQMANEVRSKRKELEKQQHEIAQNIFAIIGSQNKALGDIEGKFFVKYKNKLVGLQRKMTEEAMGVGVVEELEVLRELLEKNHPRIFNKIMAALEAYKDTNTAIVERMENLFAYYPPAEKKFAFRAQWLKKIKDWVNDLWDEFKLISEDLYDYTFPEIDESIDAVDEFIRQVGSETRATKIKRSLESL